MTSGKLFIGAAVLFCLVTVAQAQVVGLATNQPGSDFYSAGAALAGVMQRKEHIATRVVPMSGSTSYTPLINRGEIEFGLLNAVDVANAYTGVDNFKDHTNSDLRLVGVVFSLQNGIAVPNDSPVKAIKDLKGLRMPSQFTAQSTIRTVQDAVLATGGLSTADMQGFPVANQFKGVQALGEGKVDAALSCFTCATVKEANENLAARGGLRFLPLLDTPEAETAMHKIFPSARPHVFLPSPAFTGIFKPTRLMVYSAFLVTSKNVPDDLVYKTLKAIHESKLELVAAAVPMKDFDPSFMAEASPVPYHPGAEKFYQEIAQWPPKKR